MTIQQTHYVFIVGPYDSTLVGPFVSKARANSFALAHFANTDTFNIHLWTQHDYAANIAEFGPIEAISVDQYIEQEVANV